MKYLVVPGLLLLLGACSQPLLERPPHPLLETREHRRCLDQPQNSDCLEGLAVEKAAVERIESYLNRRDHLPDPEEAMHSRVRWYALLDARECRPLEDVMAAAGMEPSWELGNYLMNLQMLGRKPRVTREALHDGVEAMRVSFGDKEETVLVRREACDHIVE